MLPSQNTIELLDLVKGENLYPHLIQQLNKDFLLTNLSIKFNPEATPVDLKKSLQGILLQLITNQYDDYLNLMYRIDISETALLKIKGAHLSTVIEQITFEVLKREYQKVWLKNRL
jgi:hypothetical protein